MRSERSPGTPHHKRARVHLAIRPGDWLVADSDGAIVIPAERVSDILDEARAKVATENSIRTAVLAGTLPLEDYEQYGTF